MSEYARIDPSGLVTIVGGSFDRVQAPQRGAGQQLFITLRALLEEGETSVSFEVKVRPPADQFVIGITGQAARRPDALPIDGHVGVVATVGVLVPLVKGRWMTSRSGITSTTLVESLVWGRAQTIVAGSTVARQLPTGAVQASRVVAST